VIKGLLIAAFIHATYNSTVGIGSGLIMAGTGLPPLAAFFAYVVIFDGIFGLFLIGKIKRYRDAYRLAHAEDMSTEEAFTSEPTEFE
jgi:hypothetical protein